jgi:hypothetical protein
MIKFTKRIQQLDRWLAQEESVIVPACKGSKYTRGLFYHKGGAGIETSPYSKRKPNDTFGLNKIKGKPGIYKGLYRVKSKQEIKDLENATKKW